jgi:hypothetical protein
MIYAITQLGELVSFAILAYGALLCLEHSDLFREIVARKHSACKEGRIGSLERGELSTSI